MKRQWIPKANVGCLMKTKVRSRPWKSGAELEKACDPFKVPDSYTVNRLSNVWCVCIRSCSIFWCNFPERSYLQYLKFRAINWCLPYHQSQFLHGLSDDIQPSWKQNLLFTLWQPRLAPLMFLIVTLTPEALFWRGQDHLLHWSLLLEILDYSLLHMATCLFQPPSLWTCIY